MNFNSPKSEPKKTFKKVDTEKVKKTEIASKPTQKPSDKPKNKIERSKLNLKSPSKNKIQHEKINLLTPAKNKIERPKINLQIESGNKILREKVSLLTPPKNKIEHPKLYLKTPPRNIIQPRKIDPKVPPRNKIVPRRINHNKEARHKLQPRKTDPKAPSRHKIEPRRINHNKEPRHKLQPRKIDSKVPPRHKIEPQKIDLMKEPKYEIQHQDFDTKKLNTDKIQVKPSHKIRSEEIGDNLIIKSFPKNTRNIISDKIYKTLGESKATSNSKIVDTLIKDLGDIKSQPKWINRLPKDELKELRNYIVNNNIDSRFDGSLSKYFADLTNLVEDIKILNNENQAINFSEISRNLIKQSRGLNLTKRGLEEVISGVYNHFKKNFDDFKLERAKRKSILGTESEKESIRCLRKECKLLFEIHDGKYKGKCSNTSCNTDFKRLPALNFHHEEKRIKTTTWNEIMHKKYYEIKNTLESQKVKPICNNCHLPENAKIFNDFKDTILKKDLFTYSSQDIDKFLSLKVNQFVKEHNTNYTAASLKLEVRRWIKKRSVIEQVFNGKCISCEEDRLPSLQTHHTNQDLKVNEWGDISRKWNIKELINDFIIEEECVCLCGNCHAMITTKNFENNIKEILGEKYAQEVKADYNKINNAIMKNANRIKKIKKGEIKLIVNDYLNED